MVSDNPTDNPTSLEGLKFEEYSLDNAFDIFQKSTIFWREEPVNSLKLLFFNNYSTFSKEAQESNNLLVGIHSRYDQIQQMSSHIEQNAASNLIMIDIVEFMNQHKNFFLTTAKLLSDQGLLCLQ